MSVGLSLSLSLRVRKPIFPICRFLMFDGRSNIYQNRIHFIFPYAGLFEYFPKWNSVFNLTDFIFLTIFNLLSVYLEGTASLWWDVLSPPPSLSSARARKSIFPLCRLLMFDGRSNIFQNEIKFLIWRTLYFWRFLSYFLYFWKER
jgi:hypothetical protein